ncbi:PTS glucose/sucrose transporter subunit IIB [Carnobacterium viridans]|uniref:PTS transporter subunit EIIB n=1 Tax=Carnobacterium viridans TaxID=174587 RepID=UPI001CFF87B9|nr:PTS glucose/sucrose transporter subunit IIB [Carnobacterium viridans]UDE95614.1 PTS glucose/sucrose transporter subunit IIB [Carnobacterium viridans]
MKENKNRDLAERILEEIGGEKNISNSTHCATRLRLVLKEENDDMVQSVKKLPGVIDVVRKGGQFQIVIGNTVDKVYTEFSELTGGERKKRQKIRRKAISLAESLRRCQQCLRHLFMYWQLPEQFKGR